MIEVSLADVSDVVALAAFTPSETPTFDDFVTDPLKAVFVARDGERIAGWAKVAERRDGGLVRGGVHGLLGGLRVAADARRRGVGRALTRERLRWIAARCGVAYYFANAGNDASIRLHAEFGFEEVAAGPRFYGIDFDGGAGLLFRLDLGLQADAAAPPDR